MNTGTLFEKHASLSIFFHFPQVSGLPLVTLLGGRFGDSVKLYRAISQRAPAAMATDVTKYKQEGYTKFQLKLGGVKYLDVAIFRKIQQKFYPVT